MSRLSTKHSWFFVLLNLFKLNFDNTQYIYIAIRLITDSLMSLSLLSVRFVFTASFLFWSFERNVFVADIALHVFISLSEVRIPFIVQDNFAESLWLVTLTNKKKNFHLQIWKEPKLDTSNGFQKKKNDNQYDYIRTCS